MSNELAILNTNLPDYLRAGTDLDETTKALMGGGSTNKRISIKGSVWRLMVNGKEVAKNEDRFLNVVIANASPKVSRSFYEEKFQEGSEPSMPDCWSADGNTPDVKAPKKQANRCVDCPQNMAGSGDNNTRACRFSQRLAVVLANDVGGDIFQLTLPAKSIFGEGTAGKWPLQAYAKMLGSKGIPITAVVTEMRFDTDSATPKVVFKPVKFLDASEHQTVITQGASEAAKRAITMTVAETDGAKVKPKIEGVKEASAAPVEAADPEPTKRSSKKTEEAAPKADLSKILSEWDD